jgi:hypothetical protein
MKVSSAWGKDTVLPYADATHQDDATGSLWRPEYMRGALRLLPGSPSLGVLYLEIHVSGLMQSLSGRPPQIVPKTIRT